MTREFSQILRQSSGTWKQVGSSQGIWEVAGEYVRIEGARESYLQDRRDILNKKYWKAGVYCL